MDDDLRANANKNWFHTIFSLFNLLIYKQKFENGRFAQAKMLLLEFSRNLKLIEPDMFSHLELVTAQWDVFFLSQQLFEFFQESLWICAV